MVYNYSKNNLLWDNFAKRFNLTENQIFQYKEYAYLLQEYNKKCNLTALTEEIDIITYHFTDSLEVGHVLDFTQIQYIADVGTGAGFPGLALKIKYPHVSLTLIEVIAKKREFLSIVITTLGLKNVTISALDWRTFLRTNETPFDLVCGRASLEPRELLRMFKPSSLCRNGILVYWAAKDWRPIGEEEKFLQKTYAYTITNAQRGDRDRLLAIFKKSI